MPQYFEMKNCRQKRSEWACESPGVAVSAREITLSSLLVSIDGYRVVSGDISSCFIRQVSIDSRTLESGSLFIALPGSHYDGHDFIVQAIEKKCAAMVVQQGRIDLATVPESDVCVIEVEDSRKIYAGLAEALFAYPALQMTMVGITGTNGKTTVTYLLESIFHQTGKQPGIIGTICYRYHTEEGKVVQIPSPFTTPEPMLLQYTLRCMADAGVDTVIMEVSSHGLDQQRLGQLCFDVAVFTNLSRDHLDYHKSMESYFAAKATLFTDHLLKGGVAVITSNAGNAGNDPWSSRLRQICRDRQQLLLTCGAKGDDVFLQEVQSDLAGSRLRIQTQEGESVVCSSLAGDFNVLNIQTVFTTAMALGIEKTAIVKAFAGAAAAPGRLQKVKTGLEEQVFLPSVFIDYAHTPDALQQVLQTVKALPHKTLWCVFGCGGDRDAGKRSLMGKIAGTYSDIVILCDDNPRSEVSSDIILSIEQGVAKTDLCLRESVWLKEREGRESGYVCIADRAQAIGMAIAYAGAGDIVLIAGKGHEQYQITAAGKHFFDDSLVAEEALAQWRVESLQLATGGVLAGNSSLGKSFGSVCTDSRKITENDIFLALKGDRFDGHDFVEQVCAAGAACLILELEPEQLPAVPVIFVHDTGHALGELAGYKRRRLRGLSKPVVVGITGSSGKTTVKEMCAAVFAKQWPDVSAAPAGRVLKTVGNFNNLIGLPLSLLPVSARHKVAVLEMGMNRPGEIARLTEIADPDIACIVNIHGAHLQGLGDIEGVARAKGELYRGCGKDAVLVVNGDDQRVVRLAEECEQKKIVFALNPGSPTSADVWSSDVGMENGEGVHFNLHITGAEARVQLHVAGRHNVSNALAAAAIAHAAGIDFSVIASGLADFAPTDRRMQIVNGQAGIRIINDTYNANPESMKAGISTLSEIGTEKRIAILGDMLELGKGSADLHREIGAYAANSGVDYLGMVGEFAPFTAEGAVREGMNPDSIQVCVDKNECLSWVEALLEEKKIGSGSYLLVKGSRGMQLEEIVEKLTDKP